MKIAYYLPSLQAPGGIERIVTFKANYFAEHFEGYDITIITSEQMGKAPHFPLSPKVKHIDLGVSFDLPYSQSIVSKVLKYPFRYYRFKQRLSNLLNELKPDITISTMRRELNFITKLKDGSLKIGEFHVSRYAYGAEALKRKSPIVNMIKKRWANRFVKNLSKLSRVIILTSEGAKDWPELTNISIIPNPISTPVEGKQTDILSHNAIAVGRYAPQKGFDMLIPAWSIVAQRHPDKRVYLQRLDQHSILPPATDQQRARPEPAGSSGKAIYAQPAPTATQTLADRNPLCRYPGRRYPVSLHPQPQATLGSFRREG